MDRSVSRLALRIVLLYVLLIGLFDVVSDQVLEAFGSESRWFYQILVAKDAVFVLLSALLLYWSVHRELEIQRQAEAERRASDARLLSILDASPDAIIATDAARRIVLFNKSAERIFGYSAAEVMGQPLDLLLPEQPLEEHLQSVIRVASAPDSPRPTAERTSVSARCKGGSEFPAELSISAFTQNDQATFIIIARDITRRLQAEEAMSRLGAIVESSDDAITSSTLDGTFVSWNAGAERLYGYTAAEVIGRPASILLSPERRDDFPQILDRLKRGKSLRHFETTRRAKDGRNVDVSLTISPIKNAEGQVVGASSIARDITERVHAYQLLEQRVEERTRELTTLLEISHTVASTLELKPLLRLIIGQLESVVNYTSAAIFTLEDDELIIAEYEAPIPLRPGQPLRLPLEQAGLGQEVFRRREPVIVNDVKGDIPLARAFQRLTGDDMTAVFSYARSWMAIPLMIKDKVIGMLGLTFREPNYYTSGHASLAQTIANQAAVAIENAKLYEQAQEAAALQERQRLARELHDAVTQTLFSASLIAEVLPRLWDSDPVEGREYLEDLRRLTRGALAEMRAMLLELRPSALDESDLGDLLRQLGDSIAGRSRLTVVVDIQAQRPLPPDVKVALYRVAQEALNNVAKHAQAGCVTVSLRAAAPIPAGPDAGGVELSISDDGKGFDPTLAFPEHFGLGIMQERAQAIGATVDIHSEPGQGTQVLVIWQAARSDEPGTN